MRLKSLLWAGAYSSLFRCGHLLSLYNLNQFVTSAIPRVKRIGFLFKKRLSEFLNGLVLFCYMIMETHSNCLISDFRVGESVIYAFSWNSITQTFLVSVRCSAKTIVKFGCFSSIVISTAVQCFVAIHKQRCLYTCYFSILCMSSFSLNWVHALNWNRVLRGHFLGIKM